MLEISKIPGSHLRDQKSVDIGSVRADGKS